MSIEKIGYGNDNDALEILQAFSERWIAPDLLKFSWVFLNVNPLIPGGNKKIRHT